MNEQLKQILSDRLSRSIAQLNRELTAAGSPLPDKFTVTISYRENSAEYTFENERGRGSSSAALPAKSSKGSEAP